MTQWKIIKGFETYEVSDMGDVRNRETGYVLKGGSDKDGYLQVHLSVKGKKTTKKVHRLVCEAFLQNPENKSDVNHINEIKSDNRLINLAWMTHSENMKYGSRKEKTQKPVYVIYSDETDEYYPSVTICARELGLTPAHIVDVLKGRRKIHHKMRFEYAEEIK